MINTMASLETVATLAKHRGFIFAGSAIYGGLQNSWDYGPLGTLLKNNLRDAWWHHFVKTRSDMFGLDAAILMNPKVWQASGHVVNFADPLVECKHCHKRFRLDDDSLMPKEDYDRAAKPAPNESFPDFTASLKNIRCPSCDVKGKYTQPRQFNLMFKTAIGSTQESQEEVYLRPELAQSMFVDFKQVMDTMRTRIPFGIAQVGKVFRNEITPGNFTFRTLEFDLMEFEYFIKKEDTRAIFFG